LNSKTVKDSFPLPRMDDILDQLSGNIWFSTLDLKSGYWQIKIDPKDKEKTAFSIGIFGHLLLCPSVCVMPPRLFKD